MRSRGSRASRRRTSRRRRWGRSRSRAGRPGSAKKPSSVNSAAPYSPCLATTTRGPISITARGRAHEVRLLGEHAQLGVVHEHDVHDRDRAHAASRACSRSRSSSSRAPASWAPVHCSRTSRWRSGWMFARNSSSACARGLGQLGLEVAEHVQLGVERVRRVQVPLVLAGARRRSCRPPRARCRR